MVVVFLRFVLCALLGGSLVSQPLIAYAQASPVLPASISYGLRSARLDPGTLNTVGSAARSWAANMTTGAVTVADAMAVRVAANDVAMSVSRTIPWAGIARGAARALPAVAVGSLLWTLFDAANCSALAGSLIAIGCAEGMPKSMQSCTGYTTACYSLAAYCDFRKAAYGKPVGRIAITPGSEDPEGCEFGFFNVNCGGAYNGFCRTDGEHLGPPQTYQALGCMSGFQVGRSDKCFKTDKSDRTTAVPIDDVPDYVPFVPNVTGDPAILAKEAAGKGVDLAPYALPGTVTGPGFAVGTPTVITTTNPDGSPGPTSSTQPRYDFSYPPTVSDPVTWTEKTQATNPDGSTTTTTKPEAPEVACGITGKPDCNVRVNEDGTKTGADTVAADAALLAKQAEVTGKIADTVGTGAKTSLPTNWGWVVPIGSCSAFRFDTTRLGAFVVDPCSSSGVALWRSLLAWYLGVMTLLYIWRSGTELKGG